MTKIQIALVYLLLKERYPKDPIKYIHIKNREVTFTTQSSDESYFLQNNIIHRKLPVNMSIGETIRLKAGEAKTQLNQGIKIYEQLRRLGN